jgi:hypothetical protein
VTKIDPILKRIGLTNDSHKVEVYPWNRFDKVLSDDLTAHLVNGKRRVGDFSHESAQRLTSNTGAQKGMRVTRHDLIPPAALREVAAVYGYGELKYPAGPDGPNWLHGMPYSWNERAAYDHISQWREGEDFDSEDGVSHLAHAIWHLLTILEFEARGIGEDDRPFKRNASEQ